MACSRFLALPQIAQMQLSKALMRIKAGVAWKRASRILNPIAAKTGSATFSIRVAGYGLSSVDELHLRS